MHRRESRRYVTLDGMRGLAALVVVAYHFDKTLLPAGYLAVDFFFALSGFVLEKAYGTQLSEGASIRGFMRARLIRLYPLFLAGTILGAAYTIPQLYRGDSDGLDVSQTITATMLSALMIPNPFSLILYPLNIVFWSIATEIVINFIFGCIIVRLTNVLLFAALAVCGTLLISITQFGELMDVGFMWPHFEVAVVRTAVSFIIGVGLARLHGSSSQATSLLVMPLFAMLIATLLVPGSWLAITGFPIVAVFMVFPALLWAGARMEPPTWLLPSSALLGDISYALYATHLPIVNGAKFFGRHWDIPPTVLLPMIFGLTVVAAVLLTHFWDRPLRRWIASGFQLRKAAMPQEL